jgi:hypothetical protein
LRSDEIRITSRQNGSIKIIKEGQPDNESGTGRAVITIQPNGTIMIDGPKIIIGSGIQKTNGNGTQIELGQGATEPIVLGNKLQEILDDLTSILSTAFVIEAGIVVIENGVTVPLSGPLLALSRKFDNFKSKVGKTK